VQRCRTRITISRAPPAAGIALALALVDRF
jgi:hypothetical protein